MLIIFVQLQFNGVVSGKKVRNEDNNSIYSDRCFYRMIEHWTALHSRELARFTTTTGTVWRPQFVICGDLQLLHNAPVTPSSDHVTTVNVVNVHVVAD